MRQTAAEMGGKAVVAETGIIRFAPAADLTPEPTSLGLGGFTGDWIAPRPLRAGHTAEYRGAAAARRLLRGRGRPDRALRISARRPSPEARRARLRGPVPGHAPPFVGRLPRRARPVVAAAADDHVGRCGAAPVSRSAPTTRSCSAGRAPGCRRRCTRPPRRGSRSRCARRHDRSTSRWPGRSRSPRRCGRPDQLPER